MQAFEAVGSDCLYAPIPPDMDALAQICAAVTAPVNALVAGGYVKQSLQDYADIGVARISLGSSLARITHRVIYDAATAMLENGDFTPLGVSIGSGKIDRLLN